MFLDDPAARTTPSRSTQDADRGRLRARTAEKRDPQRIVGVLVGELTHIGESGEAFVDYPGNSSARPLAAISTLALTKNSVGRRVVLMFEEGNPRRPVVMGLVEDPATKVEEPVELLIDKRRVVLTAEQEIVLRCGQASITLTRAGKVLIRGAYLLSRSSGANRIKGGSVQIN